MKKLLFLIFILGCSSAIFSQTGKKTYFNKSGEPSKPELAYYYRTLVSGNLYKSFYLNESLYFEGKITKLDPTGDLNNTYSGTCKWYYKNGKTKLVKTFNDQGKENGVSTYYHESGKIWKEITYVNGAVKDNSFVEYDETGLANRIFEEDFSNNSNDWDLYNSDKSSAQILNGALELSSATTNGTSRMINLNNESSDIILEANIDVSELKEGANAGIIFGFKDWQNYNFFVTTQSNFYVGTVFEGLTVYNAEEMFTSAITSTGYNNLKILNIGDKSVFSINGEIQLTSESFRLFGSKYGIALSGANKVKVDKLIYKEVGVNGSSNSNSMGSDQNIRSTGSGLIISKDGYIATNYHVIEDAKGGVLVEVSKDGVSNTYKAVVVKSDKDNDVSILKIDDSQFTNFSKIQYAFKENGALNVGSTVYTIGYPMALSGMGKDAKFTDGKISSKTGYNNSINSFQTTVPVQPGNSGGPLFDDKGKLIGLINAKIKDGDNVSYAIKLNYLKNLVEALTESVELPTDTSIGSLPLPDQIKVLSNYVVLVKVK